MKRSYKSQHYGVPIFKTIHFIPPGSEYIGGIETQLNICAENGTSFFGKDQGCDGSVTWQDLKKAGRWFSKLFLLRYFL